MEGIDIRTPSSRAPGEGRLGRNRAGCACPACEVRGAPSAGQKAARLRHVFVNDCERLNGDAVQGDHEGPP